MIRHGWAGGLVLLGLLLAPAGQTQARAADDKGKPLAIGKKLLRGTVLRDLRGNRRAVHDFKGYRALVLVFVGSECPVSNLYLPELLESEKVYRARQVQFLAVYPNDQEDLDQIAVHASDRDVPFPVLKDVGGKLADMLGVTRL